MMDPGTLFAALAVGVLGGVHCLGMCGGIVGAISLSHAGSESPAWPRLLAYNLGRMSSYVLAGALAGLLGAALLGVLPQGQRILELLAAAFLILLGLYLGGWWPVLARLERLGGRVWKRIEPLGRRFIPVRHAGQAFVVGGIWGWLPCGLVYSVLVWALSAGSAADGALLMAAFALGTLPNLMLMGLFAARLARFVRSQVVRQGAGVLLIAYGLWRISTLIL
ncbi:sulfite exporter TauE/SafE family protein [Thioalkalivibrio sp.]|uniref:sulfite exporter TauE/SafE family protein n=1 Tax=Thioalkalivibrio sp. TaxID=2093813 RepID=UPI0039770005